MWLCTFKRPFCPQLVCIQSDTSPGVFHWNPTRRVTLILWSSRVSSGMPFPIPTQSVSIMFACMAFISLWFTHTILLSVVSIRVCTQCIFVFSTPPRFFFYFWLILFISLWIFFFSFCILFFCILVFAFFFISWQTFCIYAWTYSDSSFWLISSPTFSSTSSCSASYSPPSPFSSSSTSFSSSFHYIILFSNSSSNLYFCMTYSWRNTN